MGCRGQTGRGQEGGAWARYSGLGRGCFQNLCSSSALVVESQIQAQCAGQPATSLIHCFYLKHATSKSYIRRATSE